MTCRFCGSAATRPAFAVGDLNRRRSDRVFAYVRCRDCGTLSLPDPPEDLGTYYGGGDYYALVPRERLDEAAAWERWRYEEFIAGRVAGGGTAIEVGPGSGQLAHVLRQAGFAVHAVERDAEVCRYLRDVVGVDAIETDDPAAALERLPVAEVVVLWHVLEHVPEPAGLLRAVARRLAPGGIVAIAIPNTDSLGFRVLGRRWAHVDAPRHLVLPPPRTLLAQLREEGLDVELVRTDDPGARHYNWFAWDRALRPLRLPGRAHRLAARAVTRLLRGPETARGSSVTVVARRPAG